jgi:hypothetical protein
VALAGVALAGVALAGLALGGVALARLALARVRGRISVGGRGWCEAGGGVRPYG